RTYTEKKHQENQARIDKRGNKRHEVWSWSCDRFRRRVRNRIREIKIVDGEVPAGKKNIAICDGMTDYKPLRAVRGLGEVCREMEGIEKRNNRDNRDKGGNQVFFGQGAASSNQGSIGRRLIRLGRDIGIFSQMGMTNRLAQPAFEFRAVENDLVVMHF